MFERSSRCEILAYQEQELGKILRFATEQVPAYHGYRNVVDRLPALEALKEFPLLDKSTLQDNLERYLPRDFDKIPHYAITTGGTSGNQLRFFVDDVSQSVETAFVHRLWKRVGYTPNSRKATFRGVAFPNLKPGIHWQYNPIYNELQFSPFHISEATIESYIGQFKRYNPQYIHGYPSAIDCMAEFILRKKLKHELPDIKAAFLVSEGFTAQQRERIEEAFETRVFSFYGHSERVIMGGECEENETYHHFPDYGILEIIADDGYACDKEGERGELVGTGLLNRSLPLIRYKTGDYATRCECACECGRNWDRFTEVRGRWNQDMIVGKNGSRISVAALNMHGPIFEKVIRYQYFQNNIGVCDLRIMVNPDFDDDDRLSIENSYRSKTGEELEIKVKVVDDIPLTGRGKLKVLVTEI